MLAQLKEILIPPADLDPGLDVRRIVRLGVAVIGVGMVGVGSWAAIAPLSGAVIAPAYVKVDMNRKVVQHQEGGIVKEILVRDGDHVQAGQVVVVLDDVRVDATVDLLRTQLDGEQAKAARLHAERLMLPSIKFPDALLARAKEPKVAETLQRETSLFHARRESLDGQVTILRQQIKETQDEAAALQDQIAAEERGLKIQKEELAANVELLKQNYVQKTRVMALERAVADYEARWGEHRAELAKARQRTAELELRILAQRNGYVQSATDESKETLQHIFDLEEKLRPSKDEAERQKIIAPIAGDIVNLHVFTPGAVIGPRDVLMEIVPDDKTLIVEARIRPEDINYVHEGSTAEVRLTAYKQRNTPLVKGIVTYVSADRVLDETTKAPFYVVHVDVPPEALAEAGNLKMQAGMPAEVFVRTDSRTAFDYLFAPVTEYLRKAGREPL